MSCIHSMRKQLSRRRSVVRSSEHIQAFTHDVNHSHGHGCHIRAFTFMRKQTLKIAVHCETQHYRNHSRHIQVYAVNAQTTLKFLFCFLTWWVQMVRIVLLVIVLLFLHELWWAWSSRRSWDKEPSPTISSRKVDPSARSRCSCRRRSTSTLFFFSIRLRRSVRRCWY